jgi:hypothetical protein
MNIKKLIIFYVINRENLVKEFLEVFQFKCEDEEILKKLITSIEK